MIHEPTHWKRPWCWERSKAGGEGDDRGWDGWMASPTQWTWVWASSGSWWWTGKPGVLQSVVSQSRTQLSDWTTWKSSRISWAGSLIIMGSVVPMYAHNRLRPPSEYDGILRMRLNIPSILLSQNVILLRAWISSCFSQNYLHWKWRLMGFNTVKAILKFSAKKSGPKSLWTWLKTVQATYCAKSTCALKFISSSTCQIKFHF